MSVSWANLIKLEWKRIWQTMLCANRQSSSNQMLHTPKVHRYFIASFIFIILVYLLSLLLCRCCWVLFTLLFWWRFSWLRHTPSGFRPRPDNSRGWLRSLCPTSPNNSVKVRQDGSSTQVNTFSLSPFKDSIFLFDASQVAIIMQLVNPKKYGHEFV